MPMVHKIKGKETLASVIDKIEDSVHHRLQGALTNAGFDGHYPEYLILVAFKEEQILEVYAKSSIGHSLLKSYPFTATSGQLGPKLKEGDRQIPEGIYRVEYLNPNSAYYLSIKVDYPNAFDISKSTLPSTQEMGGDIFIHGKASTIGCIPIGDDAIEEVFLLTQKAMRNEIKVIISPRDFRKNASYPEIVGIKWETELYDIISSELGLIISER